MKVTSLGPLILSFLLVFSPSVLSEEEKESTEDAADTSDKKVSILPAANKLIEMASSLRQTLASNTLPMGLGGLMMGSVLYGMTLVPAVMVLLGGGNIGSQLGGVLSSLGGLGKRSLTDQEESLPLLDAQGTKRLMTKLDNTFQMWNIRDEECRKFLVCEVYQEVASSGMGPDTDIFLKTISSMFRSNGKLKRSAQDLPDFDIYYNAARTGLDTTDCGAFYPCQNLKKLL
ncbi:uncharacterized protein LOC111087227 [Limulus polyphemus]|uniref:Uncharacterized protein LOC111087227 n=1 Tax=Limulus polyphemus TaxID=6850 RepID=A0ABM1SZ32_LIMPO|nr:uncharacterized protein LOC111087227 [Limulus polyphemus]